MLKAVEMTQSNGGCRDPDSRAVYEGRLFEPQYRYVVLSTCVIALPSSCRFAADHLDWQRQRLSFSHELELGGRYRRLCVSTRSGISPAIDLLIDLQAGRGLRRLLELLRRRQVSRCGGVDGPHATPDACRGCSSAGRMRRRRRF